MTMMSLITIVITINEIRLDLIRTNYSSKPGLENMKLGFIFHTTQSNSWNVLWLDCWWYGSWIAFRNNGREKGVHVAQW